MFLDINNYFKLIWLKGLALNIRQRRPDIRLRLSAWVCG